MSGIASEADIEKMIVDVCTVKRLLRDVIMIKYCKPIGAASMLHRRPRSITVMLLMMLWNCDFLMH